MAHLQILIFKAKMAILYIYILFKQN